MEKRIHNFNAGPAALPLEVLQEAQKNLVSYQGLGLSVMEMSHRSKEYGVIIEDARNRAKTVFGLNDDYEVLYLGGGASTQFLMVAMNFLTEGKEGNYINTGVWATKAIKEAKRLGNVHVAASSEDKAFSYIPKEFTLSENPAYLHITTNNTIRGTEWHHVPEVPANVPLIADMSSDMMSWPIEASKFAMIYAGAQKNIGPSGATMVILRKDMLESIPANLPTMLDYNTHVSKDSMFNTPPCWNIYIIGLVLQWIEKNGGLAGVQKMNIEKAAYIYDMIDQYNEFYKGTAAKEDRSLMNITFRLPTEELEKQFIKEAAENDMIGLKGHRSAGGCRASVYNSCPLDSARALGQFMEDFVKKNG